MMMYFLLGAFLLVCVILIPPYKIWETKQLKSLEYKDLISIRISLYSPNIEFITSILNDIEGTNDELFNSGDIIFTNISGQITKQVKIISGNSSGPIFEDEIGLEDIKASRTFEIVNVPTTSKIVHIYGWIPSHQDHSVASNNSFTKTNLYILGSQAILYENNIGYALIKFTLFCPFTNLPNYKPTQLVST